jgi:hypothetical protein
VVTKNFWQVLDGAAGLPAITKDKKKDRIISDIVLNFSLIILPPEKSKLGRSP